MMRAASGWRKAILATAFATLAAGCWISIDRHPEVLVNLAFWPVAALALFAIPLSTAVNAFETVIAGRVIGVKIPFPAALEITIIGSAANMLPLPGGSVVRVAGLKAHGGRLGAGVRATVLLALVWAGVAFAVAGGALWALGQNGFWFAAVGGALLVGGLGAIGWETGGLRVPLMALAQKAALVVLDGVRLHLALLAIGVVSGGMEALVLASSSVVGSAVSVVPAGLGVREAAAAYLAGLAGLEMEFGFLASMADRIVAFALLALAAGVLLRRLGGGLVGDD